MSELLLIDLGNTRLKWTTTSGRQAAAPSRALAHRGQLSTPILDQLMGEKPAPDAVICAAVAKTELRRSLDQFCAEAWQIKVEYALAGSHCQGLVNSYERPERLGVDRWLAMLAARSMTNGWICVIDAGTAITVDLVDPDGQHQGGWIVPGERLMREALAANTGQIRLERGEPNSTWGCSSAEAVALGTRASVIGLIKRAERQAIDSASGTPQFVVTGGNGSRIIEYLGGPATLAPDLVLDGLALWAREMRNN